VADPTPASRAVLQQSQPPEAVDPHATPAPVVPGPREYPALTLPRQPDAELADRYRLLLELIPDGVVVHQEGRVVFSNRAAIRLVGLTDESQVLGRLIGEFVRPECREALTDRLRALVDPGVPSPPAEMHLCDVDGGAVPIESTSALTTWEGHPAYQVLMRDLTVNKLAERALTAQAALVEHVADAIIGTDLDGVVTSWNPAAESVFGWTRAETVGEPLVSLLGRRLDPPALASTGPVEAEVVGSDGRLLSIRATATLMSTGQGYVLLCTDETGRRQAEHRFRAVVSGLDEAVIVAGPDGLVDAANPAAEQLLEMAAGDLIGYRAGELPLRDRKGELLGAANPLATTLATGRATRPHLLRVHRTSGAVRWVTARSRPLDSPTPPCATVLTLSDVTERHEAAARVEHAATHDPLTGLPNRERLHRRIADLGDASRRHGERLVVLLVDLDGFKIINESAGHEVGDEALLTVGQRLRDRVRREDVVARPGGDEFVVLATVPDDDDGMRLAQDLLAELGRPLTGVLSGHHLRASAGLVVVGPDDARTAVELLRDADAAMHEAKAAGGGRVAAFDARLRADMLRRIRLGRDLREALAGGAGLWMAYQPLVDARTRRTAGAEALARWDHPELGAVPPMEFVAIAEQSGSVHPLGRFVLRRACADVASRIAQAPAGLRLSVNLSPRQLDEPGLAGLVAQALEETGTAPEALCLEVTESVVAIDDAAALRTLHELRAMGVSLAIDDFGTGYSSLARLRTLPVDELKIDRSFVTTLPDDAEARVIVGGVIQLAHTLDMRVVAEGVETARHADILAEMGCDLLQGYHFSRPVPIDQLFPHPPS